jgi:hypothetical protein
MVVERNLERTGYYFNNDLRYVALIAKGVRLPSGRWVRIADDEYPPWKVQQLIARVFNIAGEVPFAALLTDFDVREFEREVRRDSYNRDRSAR